MASGPRFAIVMAGGSGERFWPLSTPQRPKQLLRLTSPTETMLEEAVRRVAPVVGDDNVFVATSLALKSPILESGIVPAPRVLAEPARRNTLGCLVWVTACLTAKGHADASVAIVTADHQIKQPELFRRQIEAAMDLAEAEDSLVTLGIRPTRPETGYGYIEYDVSHRVAAGAEHAYGVQRFREKPNLETAQEFLDAGNFLWNSGMFFYRLAALRRELAHALPEADAIIGSLVEALRAGDAKAAQEAFERLPNLSIDYAVMEKAERMHVLPADFPWDDVGAWDSLERSLEPDEHGNILQGHSVVVDSSSSIVVNDTQRMHVGVLGVDNLVVVVSENAVLVVPKSRAQEVKRIAAQFASDRGRAEPTKP